MTLRRLVLAGVFGALVWPGSALGQEPVSPDLVTNGSFEDPDIQRGTFAILSSITGWSHQPRPGTTSSGIEIQDHLLGSPAAGAGDQFVELDSDGPSRVFQTVPTTPGSTYRVAYLYSARPFAVAAESHFSLTAGSSSQEIGPLTSGSQTSWITSTLNFLATAETTEISFLDLGPEQASGGQGAYIDEVRVQLLDSPPDCSAVAPRETVLWPANRRFVTVSLAGASDPDGDDVTLAVTGVTQDEPVGDNGPDAAAGPTPDSVQIRAERDRRGDGRVYWIAYTATDAKGSTCSGVTTVSVPLARNGAAAVDSGGVYDSFGP